MSSPISRSSSRARPGGGWELAVWYGMRLTGLGLFVTALAHYIIVHFLFDPSQQTATGSPTSDGGTSPGGRSTG